MGVIGMHADDQNDDCQAEVVQEQKAAGRAAFLLRDTVRLH